MLKTVFLNKISRHYSRINYEKIAIVFTSKKTLNYIKEGLSKYGIKVYELKDFYKQNSSPS
ncbi:hypothetical protein J4526_07650 [Desulfurococcaceae archaeon MEX13E-LK6-19]|nr:hypothetical protein J4526_07650 [Desulfurococcaceae archaeon MEX13E-LK6-19]